ncbi:MAG: phage tail sheath C-terminal domain-containing protein [Saprospiraceae bacterium]|nr:phage tail sheath C-terminal domain-containing protein [Saprospiraceae bacterium]
MATYKTPGVYVEEISIFPPSVAQVETAIPVFIGLTQTSEDTKGNDLEGIPTKIKSMVDYRLLFGGPEKELPTFTISGTGTATDPYTATPATDIPITPTNMMYYALLMYFGNGGGPCYIQSIGAYGSAPDLVKYTSMLGNVKKEDEITLFVFPDLINLANDPYHDVLKLALMQCADLGDRFVICDVREVSGGINPAEDSSGPFRTGIGTSNLMYGAGYYPYLKTTLNHVAADEDIVINGVSGATVLRVAESAFEGLDPVAKAALEATSLFHASSGDFKQTYYDIKQMISDTNLVLPPSSAMAGIYAAVDANRGVWKAPANVSLNQVSKPNEVLDNTDQDGLNVHTGGKSINAIRYFTGNGTLVWGARTLDGNSNEWRYISVRRFFNMVEESVKKASEFFVFEPNDANTWIKIKSMIENFLILQWRDGALMGAKPEDAFFVKVGLGETMSADDVLNGKLIVEIGMAVVRPAEFIILKFSHKMIEA